MFNRTAHPLNKSYVNFSVDLSGSNNPKEEIMKVIVLKRRDFRLIPFSHERTSIKFPGLTYETLIMKLPKNVVSFFDETSLSLSLDTMQGHFLLFLKSL